MPEIAVAQVSFVYNGSWHTVLCSTRQRSPTNGCAWSVSISGLCHCSFSSPFSLRTGSFWGTTTGCPSGCGRRSLSRQRFTLHTRFGALPRVFSRTQACALTSTTSSESSRRAPRTSPRRAKCMHRRPRHSFCNTSAGWEYCEKCRAPKPQRAHHCSQCGQCVLKMDHHCVFLGSISTLRCCLAHFGLANFFFSVEQIVSGTPITKRLFFSSCRLLLWHCSFRFTLARYSFTHS